MLHRNDDLDKQRRRRHCDGHDQAREVLDREVAFAHDDLVDAVVLEDAFPQEPGEGGGEDEGVGAEVGAEGEGVDGTDAETLVDGGAGGGGVVGHL